MEQTPTIPQETAHGPITPQEEAPVFQPPKKKRKWLRRLAVAALVLLAAWFFILRPMMGGGRQMPSNAYLSGPAQIRDMTVIVSSTGTVTPIDSYRVSTLVMGEILDAPFEEGDWVEKGDLLYRFDAEDAETNVERAELTLRQAQLSYQSTQENFRPVATGAGVVQRLYVKAGDSVNAGTPIAEIADNAVMTVEVPFHTADAAALFPGQSATVTLEGTLETLPATVRSVSGAEEVGLGNVLLRRVTLEVQNPGALAAGASATATAGGYACAAAGQFQQNLQHTIIAKAAGEISALHVAEGDRVSYGQVLCAIGGTAAETALENARISLQSAELGLDTARRSLDNYIITAPISGEVIEKNFKAGDKVESNNLTAAGGSIAVIYDMSTLTFEMKIDELDINKIELGQEVIITADAVEGASYTGYVDKINVSGNTISGMTTYPITVVIENPDGLKPGMNVSAEVVVEKAGTVLCVPVDAVKRGLESPYVLVVPATAVNENGTLRDTTGMEERPVTPGRNDDRYIEITVGLDEGEIVVWENQASDLRAMMMGG